MAFTLAFIALGLAATSAAPTPQIPPAKVGVEAWERGDFARAVELWRAAAIAGDADAQFNLGQAYKLGRGVAVDLKQAEDWFRRAALQGHPRAQDNYGLLLYQNGKRVEAMPLLETSANRGEPRAQYVYGTELFNGELAEKDWVRAYAMMTRASAAGVPRASENLAQMDRYIPAAERQRGVELARTMERQRPGFATAATGTGGSGVPIRPVEVPPSLPESDGPGASYPVPGRPATARPAPAPVAASAPASAPARASVRSTTPPPAAAPSGTGGWRVQLGAFGEAGRAQSLWESLSARVGALGGKQPFLVKGGAVTRLQAGGWPNKAAANAACGQIKAAGQACLVVAP